MTTDIGYTYTCVDCGHSVQRPGTSPPQDCPKCGARKWSTTIEIRDELATPIDEFDMTATDKEGRIVAERIAKNDKNTSANLATDAGYPAQITVDRKRRVSGFVEEGQAVSELAQAYNSLRGSHYSVEPKAQEDSGYADRVLLSVNDHPKRVNVQVRNLDTEVAADIGKQGQFRGHHAPNDLIALVREAIDDKAMVDAATKAQTILLLIIPTALGQILRREVQKEPFHFGGFMDIWIAPFHEKPFALGRG